MLVKVISAMFLLLSAATMDFTSHKSSELKESKLDSEFVSFLSQFPIVTAPYDIGINDLERYRNVFKNLNNRYSPKDFIPQDLANKFILGTVMLSRRSAPAPIVPVSRFYVDDHHIAVIFASIPYRGVDEFLSIQLKIFNLEGKSVIHQGVVTIASSTPEDTETVYFTSSKNFSVVSMNNIRKQGFASHELRDNHIVKYTPRSISHTSIDKLIKSSRKAKIDIATLNP